MHTLQGSPIDALTLTATGCNAWNEGLETGTAFGNPALVTIANTYAPQSGCMNNPQLTTRLTTLNDTNQQSQTVYQHDSYGNITDRKDYDWGAGAPGQLLREIQMLCRTDGDFVSPSVNLVALPYRTLILNGSGAQASFTDYEYDEYSSRPLQDDPGIASHDSSYNPGYSGRGNLTTIWRWQAGSTNIISAQYTYDIAGNIVAQNDGNGNTTTIGYNDDGQNLYALPTSARNALGQSAQAAYDYNIQKPTAVKDLNNNATQYSYNDPLDRPTQRQLPNGGQIYYGYPGPKQVITQQDQNTAGDAALKSQQL